MQDSVDSSAAESWPGSYHHLTWMLAAPTGPRAEGHRTLIMFSCILGPLGLKSRTHTHPHAQLASHPGYQTCSPAVINTPADLQVKLLDHSPHILENQLSKCLQAPSIGPASCYTSPFARVTAGKVNIGRKSRAGSPHHTSPG